MEEITFDEYLDALEEAVENPEETKLAIERVKMFRKQVEHLFETLTPENDDAADLYQSLASKAVCEWLEGYVDD